MRQLLACIRIIFLLSTLAWPTATWAARKLTLQELQTLLQDLEQDASFPLHATPRVLNRLNGYRTNAAKRQDLQAALQRRTQYEPMLTDSLQAAELPFDLLAIPLTESKFKNIAQKRSQIPKGHKPAAGIWMFITSAGRTNGLIVSQQRDDRMDVELSTKAAIKLLKANYVIFKDWLLAVQAYNQGEVRVERAMKKAKSRDAWRLVTGRFLNNYLTYVTAGAIILRYPGILIDENPKAPSTETEGNTTVENKTVENKTAAEKAADNTTSDVKNVETPKATEEVK